jgi:hypothetical protein
LFSYLLDFLEYWLKISKDTVSMSKILQHFLVLILEVLEFELRASHLLGKHSTLSYFASPFLHWVFSR